MKYLRTAIPMIRPVVSLMVAYALHYGLMISAKRYYAWAQCDSPNIIGSVVCTKMKAFEDSQREQVVSLTHQMLQTGLDAILVVKISELL